MASVEWTGPWLPPSKSLLSQLGSLPYAHWHGAYPPTRSISLCASTIWSIPRHGSQPWFRKNARTAVLREPMVRHNAYLLMSFSRTRSQLHAAKHCPLFQLSTPETALRIRSGNIGKPMASYPGTFQSQHDFLKSWIPLFSLWMPIQLMSNRKAWRLIYHEQHMHHIFSKDKLPQHQLATYATESHSHVRKHWCEASVTSLPCSHHNDAHWLAASTADRHRGISACWQETYSLDALLSHAAFAPHLPSAAALPPKSEACPHPPPEEPAGHLAPVFPWFPPK